MAIKVRIQDADTTVSAVQRRVTTYPYLVLVERDQDGNEESLQLETEIAIGTTPPANPAVGDLWVDTN